VLEGATLATDEPLHMAKTHSGRVCAVSVAEGERLARLPEAGATPESDLPESFGGAVGRWPLVTALGVLLLPLLVSAWVLLVRIGSGFHDVSDNGQNEIHTRDVGRRLVALGPYSRDGWNHLGPAMYYLLAIPYRLTGSHSVGMYVGALLMNAIAVTGIVVIAWRRGKLPMFASIVLGVAVLTHSLGADFLRDPWNPYITVLPFALLLMLVWELSTAHYWALPASAGIATFLVQTHVGYVPLAIPLVVGGAVWLLVTRHRRNVTGSAAAARSRLVRAGIVTAMVLAVMWLPPLIGVIRHTPGNLVTATRYFSRGSTDHSLGQGERVVMQQFSFRPPWVTGALHRDTLTGEPDFVDHAAMPWLLIPFAGSMWMFWRRRHADALTVAVVVAFAAGLGIIALSRTIGPLYTYRLRWTWVLGMLAAAVVAWAAWIAASSFFTRSRRRQLVVPVATVGILLTVALTGASTVNAARTSTPATPESRVLSRLFPPLLKALPHRRGVVLVASTSFESSTYSSGILLWMERLGVAVRTPDNRDTVGAFGEHRVYHGGPIRAIVTIAVDAQYDELAADKSKKLVAYDGLLAPAERVVVAAELAALGVQHRAGHLSDLQLLRRTISVGRRLGHATGFFLEAS